MGGGGRFSVCSIFFFRLLTLFDFFLSVRGLARYFFVCMHVYTVFCFYIFWYIIGNWTNTGACNTLCSLNNERTSIQKMVVLHFFMATPMINMYVKNLGKLRLYIETQVG